MIKNNSVSKLMAGAMMLAITASGCSIWNKTFHKKKTPPAATAKTVADSTKKTAPSPLKPYKTIITKDVKSSKGFLTVHSTAEKYYWEIPDSIFGRDILVVNRVAKASADMRNGAAGYAGDQIGEAVYQFEKGPSNKIFLRRLSFSEYSPDSTRAMFAAVKKNNIQAIAQAFPILSKKPDSSAVVIDVTEFLNSDNDVLYFQDKKSKDRAGMGAQQNDRSYVESVRAFPSNVEIRAVKTYSAGLNPTSSNYTVELNSSMVLLPGTPMRARLYDPRVGYFATGFRDFDIDPQGVRETIYARRWKLEPKPADVDKYLRGELVEPAKPIVFYIDPATPKKWVPYLIQGVNDWQKAFEKAGFKNAIYAKEAPKDSTWSIDDATHSAIIYRPSVIANAMGPNVCDPRSGQIIESHIFWYHNVMSLLKSWYRLQAGAVDKRARKPEFDDELMGQLIRFVSSHEVGHTLGLRHNFGSSSTVPVEKLRDKAWVEAHGHTPSIMDYARFNYVAQPEDNISEKGIFPRIGDYDMWAIQWGYRWRPQYKTSEEEQAALQKIVTDSLKSNHRLWFGSETEPFDARCEAEDLGDDAVKAGTYGMKNLKRILPQLPQWVNRPNDDYQDLLETYQEALAQYGRYLGHAIRYIGSVYHNENLTSQPGPAYIPAPYQKQKDAVRFINEQMFTTPTWLNNQNIMNKFPYGFGVALGDMQREAIASIISRNRLSVMWTSQQENTGSKIYTVEELLSDLDKGIFSELAAGKNVSVLRRNLQKIYIYRLEEQAFAPADPYVMLGGYSYHFYASDFPAILKDRLRSYQERCRKALKNSSLDKLTRLHYQDLIESIDVRFKAQPLATVSK